MHKKYYQKYCNGGEPFKTTAHALFHFSKNGFTRVDLHYKEIDDKEFISRQYPFDTYGNIDACVMDLKTQEHGLTCATNVFLYKNGTFDKIMTKYSTFYDNGIATAQHIYAYSPDS